MTSSTSSSSKKRSTSTKFNRRSKFLGRISTLSSTKLALLAVVFVSIVGGVFIDVSHAASAWTPVYNANFPDPSVLLYGGEYYAYATQTAQLNVPMATSPDGVHWTSYANDALPKLPSWAYAGKTWAPNVVYNATTKKFIMFYAALKNMPPPRTHCIGEATSSSPTGPFVDTSTAPFLCQPSLGGTIDPDLFVDSNGNNYLYVKNAGNSVGTYDAIWVQPLTSSYQPTGSLSMVLKANQSWQNGIIEGPGMVKLGGKYLLFYAGNNYASSKYAIGYATCTSPTATCTEGPNNPVLTSAGSMLGPGSPEFFVNSAGQQQVVFAAWYNTVNTIRAMYEANVSYQNSQVTFTPVP